MSREALAVRRRVALQFGRTMVRSAGVLLVLVIVLLDVAEAARSFRRLKRDDVDNYNDDLRRYARPHAGTRIIHGTAQRYAPNEWPKWYVWTMMNWGAQSKLTPSNRIGQGGGGGGSSNFGGGGSSFAVNGAGGGGGGGAAAYGRRRR